MSADSGGEAGGTYTQTRAHPTLRTANTDVTIANPVRMQSCLSIA